MPTLKEKGGSSASNSGGNGFEAGGWPLYSGAKTVSYCPVAPLIAVALKPVAQADILLM